MSKRKSFARKRTLRWIHVRGAMIPWGGNQPTTEDVLRLFRAKETGERLAKETLARIKKDLDRPAARRRANRKGTR
jgi:hypothetical protein